MLGKNEKVDALVIARGGSLRLPLKNIYPFCGHPLVAWSIVQLKCSKWVNDVYLSTDHEEIAKVGDKYGAKIIMRPPEICQHDATAGVAYKHAILEIRKEKKIDDFISLLPTSPVKHPGDVDKLIEKYKLLKVYQVGTCSELPEAFILKLTGKYSAKFIIMDKRYCYVSNGLGMSIQDVDWIINQMPDKVLTDRDCELNATIKMEDMPDVFVVSYKQYQQFDIDTLEDLRICEALMKEFVIKGYNNGMDVYYEYKDKWKAEQQNTSAGDNYEWSVDGEKE